MNAPLCAQGVAALGPAGRGLSPLGCERRHHGSYMQQDRSLKGKDKAQSYQFMLRLKARCDTQQGTDTRT
jgi:hypothetical protein